MISEPAGLADSSPVVPRCWGCDGHERPFTASDAGDSGFAGRRKSDPQIPTRPGALASTRTHCALKYIGIGNRTVSHLALKRDMHDVMRVFETGSDRTDEFRCGSALRSIVQWALGLRQRTLLALLTPAVPGNALGLVHR